MFHHKKVELAFVMYQAPPRPDQWVHCSHMVPQMNLVSSHQRSSLGHMVERLLACSLVGEVGIAKRLPTWVASREQNSAQAG